ncbi:MAG: hypothetical protein K0U93_26555 [Gammaproteobacteria bacterium]|nr:hypothetical protein [Gammaproteobacteria bacterium]
MNHDDIRNLPLVKETLQRMADAPNNQSRRRFGQVGLGAGLVTLAAGRPVWANHCTVSGMMSGNMSRFQAYNPCQGCGPTNWLNDANNNNAMNWRVVLPTTPFESEFMDTGFQPGGVPGTFLEALALGDSDVRAQAAAALLNAYLAQDMNPGPEPHAAWYGLEPDQVKYLYDWNFQTNAGGVLATFQQLNTAGQCPLM